MNLRSLLRIKFINIQGLTYQKYLELEELIDDDTILCVTETQQKIDKLNIRKNLIKITQMRKKESKKGGGLMIITKQNSNIEIEDIKTLHEDCLQMQVKFGNLNFKLITVYMSCHHKENKELNNQIERAIQQNYETEPMLIVGDFNAHLGVIIPDTLNENGRTLLKWLEQYNLILLNNDPKCQGTYTWSSRGQKSIIDYAIINQKMYQNFKHMNIDEENEIFDISDHNLIEVKLHQNQKVNQKDS